MYFVLKSEAILSGLGSEIPAQLSAFCTHNAPTWVLTTKDVLFNPTNFRNPRLGGSSTKSPFSHLIH